MFQLNYDIHCSHSRCGRVYSPLQHCTSSTTTSQNTARCFPLLLLRDGNIVVDAVFVVCGMARLVRESLELVRRVERFSGDTSDAVMSPWSSVERG